MFRPVSLNNAVSLRLRLPCLRVSLALESVSAVSEVSLHCLSSVLSHDLMPVDIVSRCVFVVSGLVDQLCAVAAWFWED